MTAWERQAKLEESLDHILDVLVEQYRPEKVILFGSLAGDTVGEWSDIDLAIIKDTSAPFLERSVEVALLCRAPVGVDYLVYTPDEFAQMVAERNPFIEEILENGKVIYEREPDTTFPHATQMAFREGRPAVCRAAIRRRKQSVLLTES